jgi:hypothetical protein
MATLAELAEHGIAGSADVLPMPVGPEPQALSAERLAEIRSLDLLALVDDRVAPVISGHLAVLLDEVVRLRAVRAAIGDEVARFGIYGAALPATKALVKRADELVTENGQLRAQVAELLAERHETNEALDDAVQELREDRPAEEPSVGGYPPALSWLALLDEDDRVEFLDELADSAAVNQSSDVRLAEVERTCATWRLIAEAQHGHNTAPGPDAVTQVFAPVASLREDAPLKGRARLDASAAVAAEATHWKRLGIEDPHDSPLHQSHRVPHDLPVPDGCRLGADDLDEISRDVWFGGGA